MHSTTVKLPSSRGLTMAGTLDFPDTEPRAFALFAHCFTCSRFSTAAARVSKTLAESGIACLRFDFPGLGQSEGSFQDTTFSDNVADIKAASDWLGREYRTPQLLVGHSLGGAAALKAATQMPELGAVATIGTPFDPAHAVLHFTDRIAEIDHNGSATLILGGKEVTISREFLEDLAATNPEEYLPKLHKPLLILHSPTDQVVGIDNARNILLKTHYPKSLISLHDADHLCTATGVAPQAARLISTWFEQHIVEETVSANAAAMPEGMVISHSTKAGAFTDIVHAGAHTVRTDREKSEGGKNLGLSPVSLVLSAVAASTSQAIRQAAKKARIKGVEVTVTASRMTVDDDRLHIRREISVTGGELSADQRRELANAADTAELVRLLGGGVSFTDHLV